ncbi:MAG: hypothetical protein ACXWZK_10985 [Solirubrobacterales bacterium]
MKRRPKWSHVTIALGVIAALAIASPVFGGGSSNKAIKKAVKKEVAKQIGKATGPQGAPGQGAPGQPGSAVAFVFVKQNSAGATDTVDESLSKNITDANVTHPVDGFWCFNGLTFSFTNVVASSQALNTIPAVQGTDSNVVPCAGDEALQIDQREGGGLTNSNGAFMVLFN